MLTEDHPFKRMYGFHTTIQQNVKVTMILIPHNEQVSTKMKIYETLITEHALGWLFPGCWLSPLHITGEHPSRCIVSTQYRET